MSEIDTSFDAEAYEAESQAKLEAKRYEGKNRPKMTPLGTLVELFASKIPQEFRDSPKMRRWIEAVKKKIPGELKLERNRRLSYLFGELWGHHKRDWNEEGQTYGQ